ncbi:hypothetical protein [Streptomyces sp. NPDC018693]|uniref:hypothetical protein n=1 Tax=unclassified Streptomyces TaxID=2593676 RepID=UPI0037ABF24A
MTAFARQPFPTFEVATRQMPHGAVERTQPLPPVNTGRPDIDATYVVATQEPATAQVLGEVLPAFARKAAGELRGGPWFERAAASGLSVAEGQADPERCDDGPGEPVQQAARL